ncbi:MAG: amidohydrolase family protein [bacterium]
MPDDLLLIAARVETGHPGPPVEALAARDGLITWIGSAAEARARRAATVIARPDAVALPGLVDAHAHPAWVGEQAELIDLAGARDGAEIVARVRAAADATDGTRRGGGDDSADSDATDGIPRDRVDGIRRGRDARDGIGGIDGINRDRAEGLDATHGIARDRAEDSDARDPIDRWLRGAGWDEGTWDPPADPAAALRPLDALPRPALLHRVDRHVAWANAAALAAAGITAATPDPPGGRIERDRGGRPTGRLVDNAIRLVAAAIPPPELDRRRRRLRAALDRFAAAGLTGVHDLCTSAAELAAWRALAAEGPLPLRVALYLDADDPALAAVIAEGPASEAASEAAPHIAGVKLFADGALGSRSAWLAAPYADAPHTCGQPIVHGAALITRVARSAAAGWGVAVHAIGDAAARDTVDAFAAARRAGHRAPLRIEHAQVVDPATLTRLAGLDVFAGVQPTHAAADRPFARARLGARRLAWAYRLRALAAAGATVLIGSDCPIAPIDPLGALAAAREGPEALDFDAALAAATRDPARAIGARRGRLAPGWPADVTLVSADPRLVGFGRVRALATVVAGRVVSRRL